MTGSFLHGTVQSDSMERPTVSPPNLKLLRSSDGNKAHAAVFNFPNMIDGTNKNAEASGFSQLGLSSKTNWEDSPNQMNASLTTASTNPHNKCDKQMLQK